MAVKESGNREAREIESRGVLTIKGSEFAGYIFKTVGKRGKMHVKVGGLSLKKLRDGVGSTAVFDRKTNLLIGFLKETGIDFEEGKLVARVAIKSREERLRDSERK
jgi:hypothetical protein